jgi:hypothetical protein
MSVLTSCSKDDDESSSNPLVGTWRAEVEEKGEQQYWEMTFNANFSWSTIEYNIEDKHVHRIDGGTYKFMDDTTILFINSEGETLITRFKITDRNKLEFLDDDIGIIYYKIK